MGAGVDENGSRMNRWNPLGQIASWTIVGWTIIALVFTNLHEWHHALYVGTLAIGGLVVQYEWGQR